MAQPDGGASWVRSLPHPPTHPPPPSRPRLPAQCPHSAGPGTGNTIKLHVVAELCPPRPGRPCASVAASQPLHRDQQLHGLHPRPSSLDPHGPCGAPLRSVSYARKACMTPVRKRCSRSNSWGGKGGTGEALSEAFHGEGWELPGCTHTTHAHTLMSICPFASGSWSRMSVCTVFRLKLRPPRARARCSSNTDSWPLLSVSMAANHCGGWGGWMGARARRHGCEHVHVDLNPRPPLEGGVKFTIPRACRAEAVLTGGRGGRGHQPPRLPPDMRQCALAMCIL